jgi:feruloyl esterase
MSKAFLNPLGWALSAAAGLVLTACQEDLPQLAAATGAPLSSCAELTAGFTFANTTIASAETVPTGALTVAGAPVAQHCLVKGEMFRRTSTTDGNSYAIMFEMRLP